MDIALVNIVPFALAVFAPTLSTRIDRRLLGRLMAAAQLSLFIFLITFLPAIRASGAIQVNVPWVPSLDLSLSLYLDGLALLFALVVTGVGACVVLYASAYFDDSAKLGRFYGLLLAFSGAMLSLVMAGNVLTLFIAWEMTSVLSFLLISFKGKDESARAGATQALIVTGGGGLALLVAMLLMSAATGSAELSTILSSGDLLRQHPWYTAITLLIFLGAFAKSAQWPLHFWLPDAMAAPTPASAYLHSATMVKAGIYLLARFSPVLGETPLWINTLLIIGLITYVIGAFNALRHRDLKACLAFSTVSALGGLTALLSYKEGLKAAAVGVLAHAMYKGALFLVAGAVDHATGTRNIDKLRGLRADMPGFAVVAGVAALSMAGLPPLFGFVAKELLIKEVLAQPLTAAMVAVGAALGATMAFILWWDVFMQRGRTEHFHHAPEPSMVVGPAMLAVGSVVVALFLAPLIDPLIEPIIGKAPDLHLFPDQITDPALLLSLGALAVGFALFLTRQVWLPLLAALPRIPSGPQIYRAVMRGIEWTGDLLLLSQNGKIRYYLVVILISVILMIATAGAATPSGWENIRISLNNASDVLRAVLLILAIGATFATIIFRRHLLAALSLGVSGYAVGGLFLLEPAPDVALVQFLVETVATVLIILILAKTGESERRRVMERVWDQQRHGLVRDLVVSVAVGLGVTFFAVAAIVNRPSRQTIATWHLENALPLTGANDVVAAIVTDFRGMDTLIEITVFGMAALGVLTILTLPAPGRTLRFLARPLSVRLRRQQRHAEEIALAKETGTYHPSEPPVIALENMPDPPPPLPFSTPLIRVAAGILMPFALLISLAHILYGSSGPGDGFTAGVVSGLAVALWYVVFGYHDVKQRLTWLHPPRFIGLGLLLALTNAMLPVLFGGDFLGVTLLDFTLPADIKLSSTTIYEVAIFLTVLGGVSAIMEAIAHPKEVETL